MADPNSNALTEGPRFPPDPVELDDLAWFRRRIFLISCIHTCNLVLVVIGLVLSIISPILTKQFVAIVPILAFVGALVCNLLVTYATVFLSISLFIVICVYGLYGIAVFMMLVFLPDETPMPAAELAGYIIDIVFLPLGLILLTSHLIVRSLLSRTAEHVIPHAPLPGTALRFMYTVHYSRQKMQLAKDQYVTVDHLFFGERCHPIVMSAPDEPQPVLKRFERDRRKGIIRSDGIGVHRGSHKQANPEAVSYQYAAKANLPLGSDFVPSGCTFA